MTKSSNYMNDFHYETILPQSSDEYGSVTNFKIFSQPSRKGFRFAKILQQRIIPGKAWLVFQQAYKHKQK